MNINMGSYESALDNGVVLVTYEVSGEAANIEVIKTQMSEGDPFAFFPFKSLTAKKLEEANSHGHLAIWFPGSADGMVKRSGNIYFALDGFKQAYNQAMKSCRDNL